MSDLVVILGAGASHDAPRDEYESPPLAAGLFDSAYDDLQQQFEGVDGLRSTIQARMSRRTLESILGDLAQNESPDIRRQVIEIPVYLKLLFSRFTGGYRPSTYDDLITLVQERGLSVTFVTLNYDTLLDQAISRKYGAYGLITSLESYVAGQGGRGWRYVKLHGSVNWGYRAVVPTQGVPEPERIRSLSTREYVEYLEYIDVLTSSDHGRLELLEPPDLFASGSGLIYPALAIPTDRKYQPVCPPEHVEALGAALRSDPAILVIGNQGLDTDLMAILSDSAPRHSNKPFRVVDKKDASAVTHRFADALHRGGYSMHPDVGFKEFVGSEEAERFFDEVREAKSAETTNQSRL